MSPVPPVAAASNSPRKTHLYHFTHIEHLATIVSGGLIADAAARAGLLQREVGDTEIKERRRRTRVPAGHGGVVAEYVPFYFAPRSPMLFRVHKGGVATYDGEQSDRVYLHSTVERLDELGISVIVSDRNAAVRVAAFSDDESEWRAPGFVDWDLMQAVWWNNTEEYPDRVERRMAECLVHGRVPWEAILAVGAVDEQHAETVQQILRNVIVPPKVVVRPRWYF